MATQSNLTHRRRCLNSWNYLSALERGVPEVLIVIRYEAVETTLGLLARSCIYRKTLPT